MTPEQVNFLMELQNTLNTQDNDCNADPVFWGVMEERKTPAYPECGTDLYIGYDGHLYRQNELDDLIEITTENESLDESFFDDLERDNVVDVFNRLDESGFCVTLIDYDVSHHLSTSTGAFLTKSACQDYIKRFGYNHKNPHTYAMTGYRNFELEELLQILKTVDFEKLARKPIIY